MDPRRELFTDDRFKGMCVYCGAAPSTEDHVPSLVFLDEPYPADLPAPVPACLGCNNGFSLDEQYVACLIECVVSGTTEAAELSRKVIQRTLTHAPALAARIRAAQRFDSFGKLTWEPETNRVETVALKLARGHVYSELGIVQLEPPDSIMCAPLPAMAPEEVRAFLSPFSHDVALWPEIGSRAFRRAILGPPPSAEDGPWLVVQPGRYRYFVDQSPSIIVQSLLAEYLACRVIWE